MFSPQMQGMYTIRKYCAKTGQLKQEVGPFSNKIVNIGLDQACYLGRVVTTAYVGTGTAPATNTDISMGNQTASTGNILTSTNARSSVVPYWHQHTYTFSFTPGQVVGNITEVGVGKDTASLNNLWSRELIVDSQGNPVTITVLADESLDIVYSARYYPNIADFTGAVDINGITYNYTGRVAEVNSSQIYLGPGNALLTIWPRIAYGGPVTLGPVTGTIQNSTSSDAILIGSSTRETYVPGSFTVKTITPIGRNAANFPGGITGLELLSHNNDPTIVQQKWQLVFDKPIPKTADNSLSLTMTLSLGRYTGPILP